MKILLIDDEIKIIQSLKQGLRKMVWRLSLHTMAKQAKKLAEKTITML